MSLARNLGLFFGHIAKAVASDVPARKGTASAATERHGDRVEVARREMTAKAVVETSEGPREVTLRRTVVDEVSIANEQPHSHET
jgi:hypothetical protein